MTLLLLLNGCTSVQTDSALVTPSDGQTRTAGPGDTVLDFRLQRSLPNAFGKADLFGRTTDAGRTTVRYIGTDGQAAVFERTDISVQSNATTMSETPMLVPSTTNTSLSGSVGSTPVYGSASSTTYRYVPPRGSSQYATAMQPVRFALGQSQSTVIEGRTLTVVDVAAGSMQYRVD